MFDINSVINRMLIYFPIFKILINNIHFEERNSVRTACTNGNTVYYSSDFFSSLTKDEQVSVVAHELMHITLKHLSRLKDRDLEIWNYATDAVINQILRKNGLPLVEGVIDCPDAIDYSAEEYYEIVKNRPDCEELMDQYHQKEQGGFVTTHEHWNEEMEESVTEQIDDISEKNITDINKELVHEDNEDFKESLEGADLPGKGEKVDIGSVGEAPAVIDWKSFLAAKRRKIVSADYNLHNGEFDEEGIYKYPYEVIRKAEIEILIDTSGSVNENLVRAFLQECKNIFDGFEIKIGCFDTKFYGFHKIKTKEELDSFPIEGRGSTDFNVAVNAFDRKAPIKIIFTDGAANVPETSSDVIWVVYGFLKINPPGGKVFYVDPKSLTLIGKSR